VTFEGFEVDGCEVRLCKIGRGVFATKDFKVGDILAVLEWDKDILVPLEKVIDDDADHAMQVDDEWYVPGAWARNSKHYDPCCIDCANHSCEPNCGIRQTSEFTAEFVCIKAINKDEEITCDYSTVSDDLRAGRLWNMRCSCGEKGCRGTVSDFRYLPKELQRKYLRMGIVLDFIRRRYGQNK